MLGDGEEEAAEVGSGCVVGAEVGSGCVVGGASDESVGAMECCAIWMDAGATDGSGMGTLGATLCAGGKGNGMGISTVAMHGVASTAGISAAIVG